MHCGGARPYFSLLPLIFARSRRTLNLQTSLRALLVVCRATRSAESTTVLCRSWHACKMSCAMPTAQLALALRSPWPTVVLCNMVTACNNPLGCPAALARPQTRQSFLAPQPRIASLRPIRPQLLDGLQGAKLLCPLIVILLTAGFSAIPAPSLLTLLALARATIP